VRRRRPRDRHPGRPDAELPAEALLTLDGVARPEPLGPPDVPTTEELLLRRVRHLRGELLREGERREAAERRLREVAPPPPPAPAAVTPVPPPAAPRRAAQVPAPAADPTAAAPRRLALPQGTPKQKLRAVAERAMPLGTPRREVAKAALLTAKEARSTAARLKSVWTIPGLIEPKAPTYAQWRKAHEPNAGSLAGQREHSRTAAQQPSVLVVVLAGDASDTEAVARTVASVREQSWEHWQVAVCAPSVWVGPQGDRVTTWAGDTGRLSEAVNAASRTSTPTSSWPCAPATCSRPSASTTSP
jgi:hypothetical protein